jgi:hypothetical protein
MGSSSVGGSVGSSSVGQRKRVKHHRSKRRGRSDAIKAERWATNPYDAHRCPWCPERNADLAKLDQHVATHHRKVTARLPDGTLCYTPIPEAAS